MRKISLSIIIFVLLALLSYLVFSLHSDKLYCSTLYQHPFYKNSSAPLDRLKSASGYTLITSLPTVEIVKDLPSTVNLIDMYGKIVHAWNFEQSAFHAYLQKDGNIIVEFQLAGDKGVPGGGDTGLIREIDWNGDTVREYKNNMLHHDFDVLPNGNWAVIVWKELSKKDMQKIGGGISGTEFNGKMFSDALLELDSNNTIVWEWHVEDHLVFEKETIPSILPRSGWTHMNSVKFTNSNPLTKTPAYLVSLRNLNSLLLVDRKTGEIIWRSPKDMVSGQHDATFLSNGNILIFDNGLPGRKSPDLGSRVIEINPNNNEIAWEFDGGAHKLNIAQFDSQRIGGAQRLDNGNTLITDGVSGRIFEVTEAGEIVWDYFNLTKSEKNIFWPYTPVFKARRYSSSEVIFPENFPDSAPKKSAECFE